MCRDPASDSRYREPWQWQTRGGVSVPKNSPSLLGCYWMVSSGSCWPLCCAGRSLSRISSSSKTGSETTYFSEAQAPRSSRRQRSEQNGKSACSAESVGFLQMGQRCFISKQEFYHRLQARAQGIAEAGTESVSALETIKHDH